MLYQIVTLPRSGAHMLATAINSHPDLSCYGELHGHNGELYQRNGDGGIAHVMGTVPEADKYIALVRDAADRELSWMRTTSSHFFAPLTIDHEISNKNRTLPNAQKNQKLLAEFIENNECLVLHYNDITGNTDIREIPEKYGQQICKYLGVEYQPLVPVTYKIKILAN